MKSLESVISVFLVCIPLILCQLNQWKIQTCAQIAIKINKDPLLVEECVNYSIPQGKTFPVEKFHRLGDQELPFGGRFSLGVVNYFVSSNCSLRFCEDFAQQSCSMNRSFPFSWKQMSIKVLDCSCSSKSEYENHLEFTFNRNYVGVIFSPYVKNWVGKTIPNWASYTSVDIEILLNIAASRFMKIATYGMGTTSDDGNWRNTDAVGLVASIAATLNKNTNQTRIQVLQGIWLSMNKKRFMGYEIRNAIESAKFANSVYPKTVWGLVFTITYGLNFENTLLQMISRNKDEAHKLGLKVGARLNNCEKILEDVLSETHNNLHGGVILSTNYTHEDTDEYFIIPREHAIFQIAEVSDFIICDIRSPANLVNSNMNISEIANTLGENLLRISRILKTEIKNDNLTIIGQAGWPSEGISYNGSPNTLQNLRDFWVEMSKWAERNKFLFYMFEAFDEPWKNDINKNDSSSPGGPMGAEAHYGWWRREDGRDSFSYIEKLTEILPNVEGEMEKDGRMDSKEASFNYTVWLSVAALILFVTCVFSFLFRLLYSAKKQIQSLSEETIKEFLNGSTKLEESAENNILALRFPYDSSYEIERDKFIIDESEIIGSGSCGVVYKGRIIGNPKDVAFKTTSSDASIAQLRNLLSEIKLMTYIGQHENIVELLGAYTAKLSVGRVYVATEFCSLGSLQNVLRCRRYNFVDNENETSANAKNQYVTTSIPEELNLQTKKVRLSDLLKWSQQIANGMQFLETKKVIHADLATRNILLTVDETAKITDFGLSRKLYNYTQYKKSSDDEPLPWRWMAPESLRLMTFSIQSDVWSFGITVWEIFSLGELPYPGLSWSVDFVDELENGLHPGSPKHATNEIYCHIEKCCSLVPDDRPTFSELNSFFQSAFLKVNND